MGADERMWGSRVYGSECRDFGALAALVLSLESPGYVDTLHVQPYTWDFVTDAPQPSTPVPTAPPAEQVCYGTVRVTTLNIRKTPGTGGAWVSSIQEGQVVRVLSVSYVGNDEWAEVLYGAAITGFAAAYYNGQVFIEYATSPECLLIRFGESGGVITRGVGWTVTIGASADTLNAAAADLRRAGYTPALTVAAEAKRALDLMAQ